MMGDESENAIEGYWWLQEQPDRELAGTLERSPLGGARLHVLGSFVDNAASQISTIQPIIWGRTRTAGTVLLTSCMPTGAQFSVDPSRYPASTDYHAQFAYLSIPKHSVTRGTEPRFAAIVVEFSTLSAWWHASDLRWEFVEDRIHAAIRDQPVELHLMLPQYELILRKGLTSSQHLHELSFKETFQIEFRSGEPRTISTWMQLAIEPLQNFLTFATGTPTAVLQLTGQVPDAEGINHGLPFEVRVLYERYPTNDADAVRTIPPIIQLLPFYQVRERLEAVVGAWLHLDEDLDIALHLYVLSRDQYHGRSSYLELAFLSAVQALQAYHDVMMPTEVIPNGVWQGIKPALQAAVPPLYRQRVLQQLTRVRFKTQKEQLAAILGATEAVTGPYIDDRDSFIRNVVTTRNYYTHLDPTLKSKIMGFKDMAIATEILWSALEMLLLRDLGTDTDDAVKLIKATRRYRNIRHIDIQ